MTDKLTSLLVNHQVPEFVREEYPLFINFLEAYYEYLETKQGTQLNDLTAKSKDLRYISDVDDSIDDFEINFFNTYASLVPRDVAVDKSSLIKNVLPLYLSTGSEASFKLLYRFMFGQELQVTYPKNNVLRASDGKWEIENTLKVSSEFYSYYTGNGTTKEFKILQELDSSQISVYVNDVKQTTGFFVRKESKKVIFNTAPITGSNIKVLHKTLDKNIFVNRKITGELSSATALIEKVSNKIVNAETVVELYVNDKTLIDTFINGENVLTNVFVDDVLVNVIVTTISNVLRINIIDGGANYNVGDPVIVNAPIAEVYPSALISKTFKGVINQVLITDGGAGFMVGERIAAVDYANTQLDFTIANVNTNSANTANVFQIYTNIITDVDPANTVLSANWSTYFPGNIAPSGIIDVSSVISTSFSNTRYISIGEISNVTITAANVVITSTPVLNAAPAYVTISPLTANTPSSTILTINTFGSLGKIVVRNGGTGYSVFDELQFTNKPMSFGTGASAIVSKVTTTGRITEVKFVPNKITGNVNVTAVSNVMIQGIGTSFDTELVPGDEIMVGYDTRKVITIASATSLNVTSASWTQIYSAVPIRKLGKSLIGGQGYANDKLPTVTINSAGGSGATIEVTTTMGDGEDLLAKGTKRAGEIEEIIVTNPGRAIKVVPSVDLTTFGDGTATANVTLNPSYETLDGRWSTSDGILSSSDRKIQGRDYYVNYSYLLSSTTEFAKYKKVFKDLLHPAGFEVYAELTRLDELEATPATLETLVAPKNIKTLSGLVNIVNTSIYVTGSNTKFNVANSLGIMTIGSYIAVNSEIRVVSSIISNTNLAVTSAFTITANNEQLLVVNTVYNAVATEITLDEIIAENELTLTVES
jgi:hypothetical protein